MGVEEWLVEQLQAEQDEDGELVRVSVRITPEAAQGLVTLAARLGKSKSSVANGLLESAIEDALTFLHHGGQWPIEVPQEAAQAPGVAQ